MGLAVFFHRTSLRSMQGLRNSSSSRRLLLVCPFFHQVEKKPGIQLNPMSETETKKTYTTQPLLLFLPLLLSSGRSLPTNSIHPPLLLRIPPLHHMPMTPACAPPTTHPVRLLLFHRQISVPNLAHDLRRCVRRCPGDQSQGDGNDFFLEVRGEEEGD